MRSPAAGALALLSLGLSAAAVPFKPASTISPTSPTSPKTDPFYVVPENIEHLPPGTLLRSRKIPFTDSPFGLTDVNFNISHQMLYRTTDSHGHATATVLTALIASPGNNSKVLSFQAAQNTPALQCAPSHTFDEHPPSRKMPDATIAQHELLSIQAALHQGWIILIPDYQGPKAAYMAGKLAGHAVLDGIRVAVQTPSLTRIRKNPSIAMWGYSSGAAATAWAAELHQTYAPELEIVGAAVGGVPADISAVVDKINGRKHAGLIAAGAVGLSSEYPDVANTIYPRIRNKYQPLFNKIKTQCGAASTKAFNNKNVITMFNTTEVRSLPAIVDVMNQTSLGKVAPRIPIFLYHSFHDQISPVGTVNKLYEFYCAHGASVLYKRDFFSTHGSAAVTGMPRALVFLIDMMNGKTLNACSQNTIMSGLLESPTWGRMPEGLINALLFWLRRTA
ncbi:Secretory lipase family protein [Metarhizium guizhouense ARSEF 977]|uniref:Secretory lipase family protein n=1 Tax=Metarhizium guizhouense (strain ARSEF 977) TaxID=1276136 RepID=A0A0B4H6G0_METGA|nr:Secretory lipase family protein [Metarhizium guizhouense ARSEF 977]